MSSSLIHSLLIDPANRWWAGYRACLPAGLRCRLALDAVPWVLEIQPSGEAVLSRSFKGNQTRETILAAEGARLDPSLVRHIKKDGAPIHVLVPVPWVLLRYAAMPAAAKDNLRQVLTFEMDRLSPFPVDQVYFDYQLQSAVEDQDTLPLRLALLPLARVAPWRELLARDGLRPSLIGAHGLWEGMNLLPAEQRPGMDLRKLLGRAAPFVLLLLLAAGAAALPLWQKKQVILDLAAREAELRKKADVVIRIREQSEKEQKRLGVIVASWTQEPPTLDVIKALTDLLPDDTSLQQMDMKDGQVILRGTSRQASSLLKTIEDSEGFSEAKFMSSVVQQRGEEQFHLSAKIEHLMAAQSVAQPVSGSETSAPPTPGVAPAKAVTESQPKPGAIKQPKDIKPAGSATPSRKDIAPKAAGSAPKPVRSPGQGLDRVGSKRILSGAG